MLIDLVNEVVSGASFFAAARTANANGNGIDMANGLVSTNAVLNVGSVSGTTPTLDVKMQESDDNTTFTNIPGANFTQVTASNAFQVIRFLRSKRYRRAVATIGGTPPSFTFGVEVYGQTKHSGTGGGYDRSPSS
jgi:hypothetical protein